MSTSLDDGPAGGATIYDVAARAGVSISTVSLTLNQPSRVAAATRDRVLAAIDDLEFVPKTTAVARARTSLARIGVLAPFSSYGSYAERLNGVLEVARNQQFEVVLFDEKTAAASTSPLVSSLPITGRLDGMIVMSLPLSEDVVARLVNRRVPTVLLDTARPEFTSIVTDDSTGGYLAGRRLLDGGKRRIAFVMERKLSDDFVSQADHRLAGLRRACVDAGVDPDAAIEVVSTTNDIAGGRQAAAQLLAGPGADQPFGIFAHHDLLAAGALQEVLAAGRAVPDEVAIVGFDDGDVAAALGLTTIRQPLRQSGAVAANALLELLGDRKVPTKRIELGLELVPRESA